jgi:hypothetical protein
VPRDIVVDCDDFTMADRARGFVVQTGCDDSVIARPDDHRAEPKYGSRAAAIARRIARPPARSESTRAHRFPASARGQNFAAVAPTSWTDQAAVNDAA